MVCDVPHIRGDAMSHISHLKGSRHHGLRFKICARIGNLPFAYRLPSQRSLAELVSELYQEAVWMCSTGDHQACDVTYRYETSRSAVSAGSPADQW